jgi:hypothetical protein
MSSHLSGNRRQEDDKPPTSYHMEGQGLPAIEIHNEPKIDLGNAAVLLDVRAGHIAHEDYGSLRLAKDGHVSPMTGRSHPPPPVLI